MPVIPCNDSLYIYIRIIEVSFVFAVEMKEYIGIWDNLFLG